jgi:NAD+ synthase (glutamine-hydrolysing)
MTNDIKQDYTVTDIEISSDEHKTYRLNHNIISKSHNPQLPFVSNNKHHLNSIINILQQSTYRRVKETHNKGVVVGISGGLDSSFVLALSRSIQLRYPDFGEIYAVNMHTHNTSDLSRLNANRLIKSCNAIHIDIPISNQVATHLHDIGHSGAHDITYQNAHARRRSSILLDLSNMYKVLHLGTGDMSEIALGWSTYGGDQLAQFNPNSNLTKTMLRVLLPHISRQLDNRDLQQIAQDIVNAPISPELKPNQKTEEELGPYDFFDFVMYYFVFQRQPIASVYRLCQQHFDNIDSNTIKKHLSTFVDRFFVNQFKRLYGCDGIRVQEYDLNNLIIRSDFDPSIYHQELNNI